MSRTDPEIKPEVQAIIDRHAAVDWRNPPHDPVAVQNAYERRLAATGLTRTVRWIADPADFNIRGAWAARDARDAWAAWDALDARAARDAWAAWDARAAVGYLNIPTAYEWLTSLIETYEPMVAACEGGAFAHTLLEGEIVVLGAPSIWIDERNRLHRATGPALAWRDTKLWYWRGVHVTRDTVEEPQRITPASIHEEHNAEVRRVMIERYGYGRYIQDAGGSIMHRDEFGTLWSGADNIITVVEVENGTPEPDGTRNRYFLSVPPTCRTALEAVAWTYDMRPEKYARLKLRT